MDASLIDVIIFAPLATLLAVLLFWFIQLLFIESQKFLLERIKVRHEPFCRFTNFIGIFFQNLCHALGYTITRSGIAQFKMSINYGNVKPKKEKHGIFEWISNSFLFIGPFFIPALFIFLIAYVLFPFTFHLTAPTSLEFFTFGNQLIAFGEHLFSFGLQFFTFLGSIDLFHPGQLAFLLLLLFFGLGIRPSYIIKEKKTRIDMIYDLKNIKNHLFKQPTYLLILLVIAYLIFYISILLNVNWYTLIFSFFGWLSIIAIIALLLAHLIILLLNATDEIARPWRLLPYLTIPISYILTRLLLVYFPQPYSLSLALLSMVLATFIVTVLLYFYRTNNFKTKAKLKPLRVADGPRRIDWE